MKATVLGLIGLSFLFAQTGTDALKGDLRSLRGGASASVSSRQMSAHILAMAEGTHEPKAATVQQFADSLVSALAGHAPAQEELDAIAADIESAMHSAGKATSGVEATTQDFEKQLMKAGVQSMRAHLVASNLERVGKEVRGPADAPAR